MTSPVLGEAGESITYHHQNAYFLCVKHTKLIFCVCVFYTSNNLHLAIAYMYLEIRVKLVKRTGHLHYTSAFFFTI